MEGTDEPLFLGFLKDVDTTVKKESLDEDNLKAEVKDEVKSTGLHGAKVKAEAKEEDSPTGLREAKEKRAVKDSVNEAALQEDKDEVGPAPEKKRKTNKAGPELWDALVAVSSGSDDDSVDSEGNVLQKPNAEPSSQLSPGF